MTVDGSPGHGPPALRDHLLNPLAIYILAALLIPRLVSVILWAVVPGPEAGWPRAVQEAAVTGGVLAAQGAALIILTLSHVTGPRGLGLPARVLGLFASGWRSGLGLGLAGGALLILVNILGSRAAAILFGLLLGEDALARHLLRERGVVTGLFLLELPWPVLALLLFSSVIMAPVSEELFFRGYLHGVLRDRLGPRAAYVSGAAFAAVHMYLVHFLPLFIIGVLLARIYERGGSLVAPIVAHATVNLVVALSVLLLRSAVPGP